MATCKMKGCDVMDVDSTGYCEDHVDDYECKECGQLCDQYRLQCELCEKWHHIKCLDISEAKFQLLSDIKGTKWFCSSCVPVVDTIIICHQKLEDQVRELKAKNEQVDILTFNTLIVSSYG